MFIPSTYHERFASHEVRHQTSDTEIHIYSFYLDGTWKAIHQVEIDALVQEADEFRE